MAGASALQARMHGRSLGLARCRGKRHAGPRAINLQHGAMLVTGVMRALETFT